MNNENLVNTFANNAGPITYFQNFEDAQLVKLELSDDPSFRTPEGSLWGPNEAGQMGGPRDQKNCDYYKPYVNPITKTSCGGGSIISRLSGDGGCVQEPGVEPSPEMHNYYEYCNADDAAWRCLKSCGTITEPLIDWMDYSSMRESELLRFSPDYESLTDGEFIIETGDDDFPEFAITTDKGGDDGAGLPTRVTAIFYYRNLRVEEAWVTVTYMLFNMVVFGVSTGAFLNEILDLVVSPMERICSALTSLSKSMKSLQAEMGEEADEFEQLGASMLKLTDLLKTSLGEAGSAIIKNNLDDDSAGINAMVPGTKMNGYFAFCDCRKFDEVLQVLEEDVMVFTNTISKIIHEAVSSHLGQPNKNIGDSWLSVWSDKEEATFVSEDGMTFADHALMTFVEAFDSISSNDTLKTLGQRSGFSKNYPGGYTPDMGAGLHRGWAIEGAVGSEAKVDATYLSPHVNMSARLEAATKQYDCKILVSEDFYNRMSTKYQRNMRKVDRVMVVGASWPMILYAYDEGEDEGNAVLEKKNRFSAEMDQAVDKYISGEWKDAKKLLFSCLGSRNNDVAATKLIDFMASAGRGDNPPDGWEGYRQLTSK
jgi:class 3 adenylate cyclase